MESGLQDREAMDRDIETLHSSRRIRFKFKSQVLKDNLGRANWCALIGFFLQIVISVITFGLAVWSLVALCAADQYSTTQLVQAAVLASLGGLGIIKVGTDFVVLATNPNTLPGVQGI